MTSRPTPGPWWIAQADETGESYVIGAGNKVIAEVKGRANAHIMASSVNLLEYLGSAQSFIPKSSTTEKFRQSIAETILKAQRGMT